ncbi:hypothetical protein ACTFIR_000682 [Dictyostelium discoideum]
MTDVPSKPPQTTPPPKPKSRAPTTIFSSPPQLPDRSSLNISHTASTSTPTPQQIHTDGNSQQPKSSPPPPPLPERQSFSNSPNRQTQSFIQKPALPPRDSQYNTISGSTIFKSNNHNINNNNNNNNNDSHIITNGNASSSFIQGNKVTRVLNTNKSEPILQQPPQSHSPQQHTPNHQQPLSPQQQKDLAQKRSTMPLPPRPTKNRPLPTPISPESHPLTIIEENNITEDKEQPQQSQQSPQPQLQQSQQNTDNSRKPIVAPPTLTIQ